MKNFAPFGWDGKADRQAEAYLQKYIEELRLHYAGQDELWQGLALGATEGLRKDLSNDKLESAVAVNIVTKEEIFRRFGDEDETPLQEENRAMIKDPNNTALIHNHWNDSPGSQADFDAALWLGVRYLIVVTPSGLQYIYEREGDTMKLLDEIFDREHVALPSPAETAESRAAYAAQSLMEIGNPAERVMRQDRPEGGIYTPVGLTVEQAHQLFNVDSERERRFKWRNHTKLKKNTYEEKLQVWEKMWTKDPEIWADYDAIVRLAPFILEVAQRWNRPESGMSDFEVAVLLIANLHQESHLRRDNPAENHYLNQLGVIKDILGDAATSLIGWDSSLGPANLRPSVTDEILGTPGKPPFIPMPNKPSDPFNDEGRLDVLEQEWKRFGGAPAGNRDRIAFLYKPENAIELMGANFYRGVARLREHSFPPTMFNMSAWMSQGIAESDVLRSTFDNKTVTRAIDHASDTVRFVNAIIANRETFEMFGDSDVVIDWDDFDLFNDDDLLAYLRD